MGPSEIYGSLLGSLGPRPIYRLNPLSYALMTDNMLRQCQWLKYIWQYVYPRRVDKRLGNCCGIQSNIQLVQCRMKRKFVPHIWIISRSLHVSDKLHQIPENNSLTRVIGPWQRQISRPNPLYLVFFLQSILRYI